MVVKHKNARWAGYKKESLVARFKQLQGDPHNIALGMGIGVFVAVTPTIPFHTAIALFLAWIAKGSKTAAILGVWVSNPLTVIFLYLACYKVGLFFMGTPSGDAHTIKTLVLHLEDSTPLLDKLSFFTHFIQTKLKVFLAMNLGGVILGIPAGILAYFITKHLMIKIRLQKIKNSDTND